MLDVEVLEDPTVAAAALDPLRSQVLALLGRAPASASGVAAELDLPRQKVRYHLKTLEDLGLVREVETRAHGGLVERLFEPSAAGYLVSPVAMGAAAAEPSGSGDRLSATCLLAVAGRAIREVAALARGARRADKTLPTLTLDAEIRFRSAAERAAFADDLSAAVVALAARYHDEGASGGRWYRLVAFAHPRPAEEQR